MKIESNNIIHDLSEYKKRDWKYYDNDTKRDVEDIIHPYWAYNSKRWWWTFDELINRWEIFSHEETDWKSFEDLLNFYIKNLKKDKLLFSKIEKLSLDIKKQNGWNYITEKNIIPLSFYIYEDKGEELFKALSNIDIDCKIIVYVNAYKIWKNNSETNINDLNISKKILELELYAKKYLKSNQKIIIIWNLYNKQKTLSNIRADLFDSLVISLNNNNEDKNIFPLDADVYDFSDWYFSNISFPEKYIDNENYIASIITQRRWTKPNDKNSFLHFNEIMFILGTDVTYWKSGDINSTAVTNTYSTVYRLIDMLKIKWYSRIESDLWEDIILWHKLSLYHWKWWEKNMKIFKYNNSKIFSDSRRWELALKNWLCIFEQWDKMNFKFISNEKNKWENITEEIFIKLISNMFLEEQEIILIENWINKYCEVYSYWNNFYRGLSFSSRLVKFWDLFYNKSSLYKINIQDKNMIKIIKK